MMRLVERDIDILKTVFIFGFLTSEQISMLYDWHKKVCEKRLRILSDKAYLAKIPIPTVKVGRPSNLYFLGQKAEEMFRIQTSKPRLNWKTSHAMRNINILIQIALTCRKLNLEYELLPEHILRSYGLDLIPDGSFKIKRHEKQALFLVENCAGTEIVVSPSLNEDIESKIIRYSELFKNNDIQYYMDFFQCEFNRFRLLYITNNYNRLRGISDVVREHDEHGFIWITTLGNFKSKGVFANIWHVPARNESGLSII